MQYNIPILFLVFNRADTATRVFDEIRKQKPRHLFIAADGPRDYVQGEKERCEEVRRIFDKIDWDCEVKTLFREKNLGCGLAVSQAISWFFSNVEEGIILEDDCLPGESFFFFCKEMLEKYKNDNRVGIISGNNFLFNKFVIKDSYYFSIIPHIWGWATWRRVWDNYNFDISNWPELREKKWLHGLFDKKTTRYYWNNIFNDIYYKKINTWDYQLSFMCLYKKYLTVIPKVNLISNIGFGSTNSTHTKNNGGIFSEMKTGVIDMPIIHPNEILRNKKFDDYIQRQNFCWWKMFLKRNMFFNYLINLLRK